MLAGTAWQVVCAGRSAAKLADAAAWVKAQYPAAPPVQPMALDVADLASVRAFVGAFQKQFPAKKHRLAVLVWEGARFR